MTTKAKPDLKPGHRIRVTQPKRTNQSLHNKVMEVVSTGQGSVIVYKNDPRSDLAAIQEAQLKRRPTWALALDEVEVLPAAPQPSPAYHLRPGDNVFEDLNTPNTNLDSLRRQGQLVDYRDFPNMATSPPQPYVRWEDGTEGFTDEATLRLNSKKQPEIEIADPQNAPQEAEPVIPDFDVGDRVQFKKTFKGNAPGLNGIHDGDRGVVEKVTVIMHRYVEYWVLFDGHKTKRAVRDLYLQGDITLALLAATHGFDWGNGSSEEIRNALSKGWALGVGSSSPHFWYAKGGDRPKFWNQITAQGKPDLQGTDLIRRIRELRSITTPSQAITAEVIPADDPERLQQLEQDIQSGLKLLEDGRTMLWRAVAAIQHEQLWQLAGHPSFEAYCKARWGWERSNSYEVASAGSTINELIEAGVPDSDLPTSAAQVRALKKVAPAQRKQVLNEAARAGNGKPTAKAIKAAANAAESQADPQIVYTPASDPETIAQGLAEVWIVHAAPDEFDELTPAERIELEEKGWLQRQEVAEHDEPLKNVGEAKRCRFSGHGKTHKGLITGVVLDWHTLKAAAFLVDYSGGQIQIPVAQVEVLA